MYVGRRVTFENFRRAASDNKRRVISASFAVAMLLVIAVALLMIVCHHVASDSLPSRYFCLFCRRIASDKGRRVTSGNCHRVASDNERRVTSDCFAVVLL